MMKKIIILITLLLCLGIVSAGYWTPPANIDLKKFYGVYNATNITADNVFANVTGAIKNTYAPAQCPANTGMVYYNGTNSICLQSIGYWGLSGTSLYALDSDYKVGIGVTDGTDIEGTLDVKSDSSPTLKIRDSAGEGTSTGYLTFEWEPSNPSSVNAPGDILSKINTYGVDDGQSVTLLNDIQSIFSWTGHNDESGQLKFNIEMDSTQRNYLNLNGYNGVVGQGTITLNDDGQDVDIIMESSGVSNALYIEGSSGNVGIGKTPAYKLDVNGIVNATSYLGEVGWGNITGEPYYEARTGIIIELETEDTIICYQETANVSTGCGGLSTGGYAIVGTWNNGGTETYDGDYNTYDGESAFGGADGYIYVNYTKPSNALNTSLWQVKDQTNGQQNVSFTAGCWNQHSDKLELRMHSQGIPAVNSYYECYDGSWVQLTSDTSNPRIFEEGVHWFIESEVNTGNYTVSFNETWGNYSFSAKTGWNKTNGNVILQTTTDNVGIGTSTPGQKLVVIGDVNVTGNFTGNQIYGGMWYHNDTGTLLNFAVQDTWYPLYFTYANDLNGFDYVGGFGLSSNLTAQVSGKYQASYMGIGSGQNNHIYLTTVLIDGIEKPECGNHHKMAAGGDVITQSGVCIITINKGQTVAIATQDMGGTGAGYYYGGNLNLVRIGDVT